MTRTIKAVRLHRHTGLEGLRLDEVRCPQPRAGEVLVQVKAAGTNRVDCRIAEGWARERFAHPLPLTLGCELAGVVAEVGPSLEVGIPATYNYKVGDEVLGYLSLGRLGAFAEFVCVPTVELAPKPQRASFPEAAAMPFGGITSWQALMATAGVRTGQRVLIHVGEGIAGEGIVGSLGVQLAKAHGATVIATAPHTQRSFVSSLGADQVIDDHLETFEQMVDQVDSILDTVGGSIQQRSFPVLKPGGCLVSTVQHPSAELAAKHSVHASYCSAVPDGAQLGRLSELIDRGDLKRPLATTYPFTQAVEALTRATQTPGKIVIIP